MTYRLPDPLEGLRIAADLTSELLLVDTQTSSEHPDGMLVVGRESTTRLMSGVHGLKWMPTGPRVLQLTLEWLGFAETHVVWWQRETAPGRGRLRILASRKAGVLADLKAARHRARAAARGE
jgi:hypothetical protein